MWFSPSAGGRKTTASCANACKTPVATGGQVWGAFLEGRLKGFASVEGPLIGSQKQYADLTSIHVSADAGATAWGAAVPAGGGDRPPAGGQGPVHLRPFGRWRARPLQGHGLRGGNRVYPRPRGAGALRLPAGVPVIKTREPLLRRGEWLPFYISNNRVCRL